MLTRRNFTGFLCSASYVLSGLGAVETLTPDPAKGAIPSDPLGVARAESEVARETLARWQRSYHALADVAEACERRRRLCFGRSGACQSCRAALEAVEMRGFALADLELAAERRWLALQQGAPA